ncbi:polyphenol oxidase [Geodermatophilus obscurus]|uniref:Polyphenol oxidase n=1 Tax=Geodermatophilus obscurus TaxID=1861 RepID=A0A1M7UKR1_9ACTN|nr:tyrosinase family protein [Geodermatophilus obscurus]SHN83612.1 polyphenol oxidase [Geodermatophilus obscurus]
MIRTRRDVAALTLADAAKARTQEWHPVLDTYAHGVRLMDQLGEDDPRSWLWAANTHGIPTGTRPRPLWNQCAHASWAFLPWHRAYLAWFEATIRELTGDEEWRLPYWDYSVPGDTADRTIPVEFSVETRTVDGQAVPNPLYRPQRSAAPIPRDDVGIVDAMAHTRYVRRFPAFGFGGTDRVGFDGATTVEMRPHNFVHGGIAGRNGLMGSTTTAARDPVFWLHHANIDRLWEVWRGLPGSIELTDPGGAPRLLVVQWRSATFAFGAAGSPATYTMDDVEDTRALDYVYESATLPDDLAAAVEERRGAVRAGREMAVDDTEPTWLPVAATFGLTSGEERDVPLERGARLLPDASPAGLLVELAGVSAMAPHQAYAVEVRATPDAQAHRAGRFSTFGLAGTPETEERSYVVDLSSVLPDLLAEGWSGGRLSVRVVPDEGAADSADDEDRSIHVRQVTVYLQTP